MKVYMAAGPHHLPPPWVNTDLQDKQDAAGNVIKPDLYVDMRRRLPFSDGTVEIITESHGLMFLRPSEIRGWCVECFRVLKLGGILRVTEDGWKHRPRIYGENGELWGDTWKPDAEEMVEWMNAAGLAPALVGPAETKAGDLAACIHLHGSPPRVWFVEGVK